MPSRRTSARAAWDSSTPRDASVPSAQLPSRRVRSGSTGSNSRRARPGQVGQAKVPQGDRFAECGVAGQHHVGVEHHRVDTIQAPQHGGVHHHRTATGQDTTELGGEGLPAVLGGLGQPGEQGVGRPSGVAGGGHGHPESGQGGKRGAVGVGLDGPAGQRCRAVPDRDCPEPPLMAAAEQLGFATMPALLLGAELADQIRPVRDVDDEAKRPLRQCLGERIAERQAEVGGRVPQVGLQQPAQAWLGVQQRQDRSQLSRYGRPSERLTQPARSDTHHVRRQGDHVSSYRLDVSGMLGSVRRESLPVNRLRLLGGLHHADQVLHPDGVPVEGDDDPAEHGVDLGPLHSLELFQPRFDLAGQGLPGRAVHPAHLDVRPPVADPHSSAPAALKRQVVQSPGDDPARVRDAQPDSPWSGAGRSPVAGRPGERCLQSARPGVVPTGRHRSAGIPATGDGAGGRSPGLSRIRRMATPLPEMVSHELASPQHDVDRASHPRILRRASRLPGPAAGGTGGSPARGLRRPISRSLGP